MSDKTAIAWTDATWNPVSGCSKVSPGCEHCYAETLSLRYGWTSQPWTGPNAHTNVQLHPERLDKPLHWKRPRMVFVNSMSDVFHDQVSDAFIDEIFAVMAMAAQHTFQILTKRPQRMYQYLTDPQTVFRIADAIDRRNDYQGYDVLAQDLRDGFAWPLPNVWLGVSVEDQRRADERIPWLQQTPAHIRFLSCEPLLGPIDLTAYLPHRSVYDPHIDTAGCAICGHLPSWHGTDIAWIDWVIVGAESGPEARPMDDDWVRSLLNQCVAADVPFFFKQRATQSGRKETEPELDGRQWLEFPQTSVIPDSLELSFHRKGESSQ